MKRAFTLIEVMISFGVSVMLIGVIYFFHFGIMSTWNRGQQKEFLNEVGNTVLERMVRELRMAQTIVSIRPGEIVFQKFHVGEATEEEAHPFTGEKPVLDTIRFGLVKGGEGAVFERQLNLDKPERIFTVQKCEPEIFSAWVMDECDVEKQDCPHYHPFDFTQQVGEDVGRIVLVAIQLNLSQQADSLNIRTKVSLPAVHARLMQPGWNNETQ